MTRAPKRLLESGELSNRGRELLEVGRTHAPVRIDVGAQAARFQAALERVTTLHAGAAETSQPASAASSGAHVALGQTALQGATLAKIALVLGPVVAVASIAARLTLFAPEPSLAVRQSDNASQVPTPAPATPNPLPPDTTASAGVGTDLASHGDDGARASSARARLEQRASDATSVLELRAQGAKRRALQAWQRPRSRQSNSVYRSADAAARGSAEAKSAGVRDHTSAAQQLEHTPAERTAQVAPETTRPIGELEGIARARALARTEPQAALALLEQLARAYPHGYFVEEREALRIVALAHAGQSDRAAQLAAAFLRKYPQSPLAESVRIAAEQ